MLKVTTAADDRGFSLIELLVVVMIIGVLAVIAIPTYIGVQNSARDTVVKSDLTNAKVAVVGYYTQTGSLPTMGSTGTNLTGFGFTQTGTTTVTYTQTAPTVATFCLQASSKNDTNKRFYITASAGITNAQTTAPAGC